MGEQNVHYVNAMGVVRDVPLSVAKFESRRRRVYGASIISLLQQLFLAKGVKIDAEIIGSAQADASNKESDVDIRVVETGATNLRRTREIGMHILVEEFPKIKHPPFFIHLWFCHPMGTKEYEEDKGKY